MLKGKWYAFISDRQRAMQLCTLMMFAAMACLCLVDPAFAAGGNGVATSDPGGSAATIVSEVVVPVLQTIAIVGGTVYAVTGAVKYAQAHAEGEGPAMHKAINTIVAGIAIVAVGFIVAAINWTSIFSAIPQPGSGGN